jgi:hypothetical protein
VRHLKDTSAANPRGATRRFAMIIAAIVMLSSISLYLGVQVEDLLRS